MTADAGGPLTDAEVRDFAQLLARYVSHDLDQWDNWQIDTSHGPVYVMITRSLQPGWPQDAFTTVRPPPTRHTKDSTVDNPKG